MKEYTIASLAVFLSALGGVVIRGLWRDRSLWLGLVIFAGLTILADLALTGLGVYGYDRRFNVGVYLGRMPLEDLAYGLALYLVAAITWSWGERHAG